MSRREDLSWVSGPLSATTIIGWAKSRALVAREERVVEAREANFLRRRSMLGISLQRTVSCARQAPIGFGFSVPVSVPKPGPRTISRQPTSTKLPTKNGPEIIDFRPVLRFSVALANHRLQPLGPLTAARKLSINEIATCTPVDCPDDCP